MKLLRCYVENYGKLSHFTYNFDESLNVILQENGWGKSTFASFIKAMLFGLPSTSKKNLDENERLKYTPWQNGKFGGWLEFSLKNKNYRIERFFGQTASKDTVNIYDLATNLKINQENFVEKLLGINADTFMRSTYMEQGLFSNANDESIKAKLGKLVQSEEVADYFEVDEKLTNYERTLQLQKGKGGKIYQLENELNDTISNLEASKNAKLEYQRINKEFTENNQKIQEINQKIEILYEKIQQVNNLKTENAVYEHFQSLKNDLQKLENEQSKTLQFFNNNPPSKFQLEEILEWQKQYNQAIAMLENLNTTSLQSKKEKLNMYFEKGVPKDEEISLAANNIQKLKKYEQNVTFSQNIIEKSNNKFKLLSGSSFGAGCCFLLLTIIFLILYSPILWIMCTIFTITGIALGSVFWFMSKEENNTPANITAQNNIQENSEQYYKIKAEIDAFINKYQEVNQNYEETIYDIKYNKKALLEVENEIKEQEQQKEKYQKNQKKFYDALINFYSQYFNPADKFTSNYTELQTNFSRLNMLNQSIEEKQANIKNFIEQNNLQEQTRKTNVDIDIETLQDEIKVLEQEKQTFIDNNLTITSKLDNASNTASNLEYYETKKIELEENIKLLKNKLKIIQNTRELLKVAKNNLTSKYLTPISDAFKVYANKFAGIDFDDISIDTDLNIKIARMGEQKDTKYFSHGIRDIIELCMRLALIKAIFEDELPPIIMDDPFYNLDDKKTKDGLNLIKELSKEFQIVYLVCHSSRT